MEFEMTVEDIASDDVVLKGECDGVLVKARIMGVRGALDEVVGGVGDMVMFRDR